MEAQFFFLKINGNAYISDRKGVLFELEVPGRKLEFSVTKSQWNGKDCIKIYGLLPIFLDDYQSTTWIDPSTGAFKQNLDTSFFQLVKSSLTFDLDINKSYIFTSIEGHAVVHSNLTNHIILDGTVEVLDSAFKLHGDFYLFPKEWPANLKGENNDIIIDASGVHVQGNLSAVFGPITIAGATLRITNEGFRIGGTVFGQGIDALLHDSGNEITFSFNVNFGPISTKDTIIINKVTGATDIKFHSEFGGLIFSAGFKAPSIDGNFDLSLGGLKILAGKIKLNGAQFAISGKIDFVITSMELHGQISSRGFYLAGSFEIGIKGIATIAVGMTINNGCSFHISFDTYR